MERVCENCKHYEEDNIGRYCYREPIPIILDDDILSCRFFEEVERMTDLILEKRIENLEKMYLMLQDEVDKKLEMLRENNNLFATEIEKLGGFQEDEEVE